MKEKIKSLINKLPYVKSLYYDISELRRNAKYRPGHFYSPIVDVEEIKKNEKRIWREDHHLGIPGIDLNIEHQLVTLKSFEEFYDEQPFNGPTNTQRRYNFENGLYGYSDGLVLYSLMRKLRPKKIIEVGSGYSSALMLDVNELFFDNQIELTFIEPYTQRLRALLRHKENENTVIIEDFVQNVSIAEFEKLNSGDILFIDSSHVVKTDSDVNFILFQILPALKSGVYVHFHDIFYPFEYPKAWVLEGRNWNEDYFLKAFLMYNSQFKIEIFTDCLHKFYPEQFKAMPLYYKNTGGNLWLRKK